jgi:hypothetical protein
MHPVQTGGHFPSCLAAAIDCRQFGWAGSLVMSERARERQSSLYRVPDNASIHFGWKTIVFYRGCKQSRFFWFFFARGAVWPKAKITCKLVQTWQLLRTSRQSLLLCLPFTPPWFSVFQGRTPWRKLFPPKVRGPTDSKRLKNFVWSGNWLISNSTRKRCRLT